MNFAFFVAPSVGEAKAGNLVALRPDERDDFVAAFQAGFDPCKLKVAGSFPDPACQDDWGHYCMEMAVVSLLFDDSKEAASHSRAAVKVWQKLSQGAPTNTAYKKQVLNASLALGIFELLNRQPRAAIATSERTLALGDSEVGFKAVLALGCIIDGQSGKAWQLLLENRTLEVWPNLTFPEAILDDLHRLEETGLSYLDKEQSEREIQSLIEKK